MLTLVNEVNYLTLIVTSIKTEYNADKMDNNSETISGEMKLGVVASLFVSEIPRREELDERPCENPKCKFIARIRRSTSSAS